MKDLEMSEKNLQELADDAEKYLRKAIRALSQIERITCDLAAKDPAFGPVNAYASEALGAAQVAKGKATHAGNAAPDLTVNFGGK